MSATLAEVAQQLKDTQKKVQLIYAFNGSGKTRLSRKFKELLSPKVEDEEAAEESQLKVLYYNAFTEDLFYWDNDLEGDTKRILKIQPNAYTEWVLKVQGQDQNAIAHFQRYTNEKLTPHFNEEYVDKDENGKERKVPAFSEVTFTYERGNEERSEHVKISKGEESNFIWSIFHSLIEEVISVLNVAEPSERETDRYDQLEYIFIDDPVSSLDETHLIELAVDLAALIKSSESNIKFILTTHNPLFYNVLHNEIGLNKGGKREGCYLLKSSDDGSFDLSVKYGDSNRNFSYHLYLRQILEEAIAGDAVERYHFTLLRNLYEKTASFLGYTRWSELLPDDKDAYYNRIIQFTNHNTLSGETVAEPTKEEKRTVGFLLDSLMKNYGYPQQG